MKKDQKKEIEELKQKIEELEDKYKRALADYQNLEKRVAEEKSGWIKMANKELVLQLLPVIDSLEMTTNHFKDQSLALSIKQLLDILKKEGLEKIEAVGKSFDPGLMECIETTQGEESKVLGEVRTGYLFQGKLLRPAMVRVGKRHPELKSEELAKEELMKGDYM